jgi:hypothetical protein
MTNGCHKPRGNKKATPIKKPKKPKQGTMKGTLVPKNLHKEQA